MDHAYYASASHARLHTSQKVSYAALLTLCVHAQTLTETYLLESRPLAVCSTCLSGYRWRAISDLFEARLCNTPVERHAPSRETSRITARTGAEWLTVVQRIFGCKRASSIAGRYSIAQPWTTTTLRYSTTIIAHDSLTRHDLTTR